ncbi:MAG: DUF5071 domain-containing protein [Butyrivibrio sp.]|uniref:DUF5071 domain-containing protein n=1 Tax=Butyrivibrio sp. TaxID=28121 RepID=UPI0025F843B5|nr:DUF5071 domain-containing protein [Butyrivibrio sp.]MCR5770013.1 DUF5071 domain-containing protein [Butyrivibrio sp.]
MADNNFNEDELFRLVPTDKFDESSLDKIDILSDPEIQIIMMELVEWLQDPNWPVFDKLTEILKKRQHILIPYIKNVLESGDVEWKKYLLEYLVSNFADEYIIPLKEELYAIISAEESDDEDFTDLQAIANKLYARVNN